MSGTERPTYRGAPLDEARGPGLGCFWLQAALLLLFVVMTPIGVAANWPYPIVAGMLIVTIVLLFFVGQTGIFLLRLVAADRRARRRPMRMGATRTVGQLEEEDDRTAPDA